MPRSYAPIFIDINDDPDVEDLSLEAQWLYFRVLLPLPDLSACGVADWRPRKWLRRASNVTLDTILAAAAELEAARFVLFDTDTEELLVRSLVRRDRPLRNPKYAAAVVKAFQGIGSRMLSAAVVSEIQRDYAENPDYSSWTHKDTVRDLKRILSRPNLDAVGYRPAFTDINAADARPEAARITNPIGNPDPIENGNAGSVENHDSDRGLDYQSDSVGFLPVTSHLPPVTTGGSPHGGTSPGAPGDSLDAHPQESEQDSDSDEFADRLRAAAEAALGPQPDPWCERHPGGTDQPCRECQAHRRRLERWTTERHRIRAQIAEARRAAVAECDLCDTEGWRIPPPALDDPPVARCDHHPDLPAPWLALLGDQPTEDTADA
ncbi:hypothetical protein [Nocardia farcinica]|uniref:hypothetical protein n=1 Tax=Nocardia farcinica TaxID=37329 RepID=UPI002457046F|nr:hypothetical protein [Nocardia farcinica]